MRNIQKLVAALALILPCPAFANGTCVVPIFRNGGAVVAVTEQSRQRCIDEAIIALPQPDLNVELMEWGPGGPNAIRYDEAVYCEFVPYRMDLKKHGKSRKFWCRRTDQGGRYFNDRHQLSSAASVSAQGFLLDAVGRVLRHENGSPQRPDVIKVKYDLGGNRGREVYTEVAVSRFLWALGFPTDYVYRAQVWCRGCSGDPFGDIRSESENHPVDETTFFPNASVERKMARSIEITSDQGFDWKDVHANARWSDGKRTEFEAYVLALNMVHFHNGRAKQNTVGCEDGAWHSDTGACSRPVLFLDDLGSTFGGGKSRGELQRYRDNTVFRPAGSCVLRADLAGFERIPEESRRFLADRLSRFDGELVRALFAAAGFDVEKTGAPLGAWVATVMQRIHEVRAADCR